MKDQLSKADQKAKENETNAQQLEKKVLSLKDTISKISKPPATESELKTAPKASQKSIGAESKTSQKSLSVE